MKLRLIAILFFTLCAVSWMSSQNLSNNEFHKAGLAYEKQASEAMNAGEYEKAAELGKQASIEFEKSLTFVNEQGLKYKAANAITLAQNGIDRVAGSANSKLYAKELAESKALLGTAKELYKAESWVDSRTKAQESLAVINSIVAQAPPETKKPDTVAGTLPRFYVVTAREKNTDCFWIISKMPEVYGDPSLWRQLYNANKQVLKNPDNPNLIHPGMIIEIPPLGSEKREGTFEAGKSYATPSE